MTYLRALLAILLSIVTFTLTSGQAWACHPGPTTLSFMHARVPHDSEVAAEVEILEIRPPAGDMGSFEARIITMLRGRYSGGRLLAKPLALNSCGAWPRKGERGIVAGTLLESSSEALVIDPLQIRVPDRSYLQIPDDRRR